MTPAPEDCGYGGALLCLLMVTRLPPHLPHPQPSSWFPSSFPHLRRPPPPCMLGATGSVPWVRCVIPMQWMTSPWGGGRDLGFFGGWTAASWWPWWRSMRSGCRPPIHRVARWMCSKHATLLLLRALWAGPCAGGRPHFVSYHFFFFSDFVFCFIKNCFGITKQKWTFKKCLHF